MLLFGMPIPTKADTALTRGGASGLVACTVFKTAWEAGIPVSGEFDSHTLPPIIHMSSNIPPDKQLRNAIREDNLEAAAQIIAAGADVNELHQRWGPTSVLRFAAIFGSPDMICLLVSLGAKDPHGLPVVEGAVGGPENLLTLLQLGGDPNNGGTNETTPLVDAVEWGDVSCVKLLLE